MFNAGLQRGKRGWVRVGEAGVGGVGVPREISLHLSTPQTDVGEYQPCKQRRGPRRLPGPLVPAQPGPVRP